MCSIYALYNQERRLFQVKKSRVMTLKVGLFSDISQRLPHRHLVCSAGAEQIKQSITHEPFKLQRT